MKFVLIATVTLLAASLLGGCYVAPVGWGDRHEEHYHGWH
jgi:hypothetical protein